MGVYLIYKFFPYHIDISCIVSDVIINPLHCTTYNVYLSLNHKLLLEKIYNA